jgi:hypothetical protein
MAYTIQVGQRQFHAVRCNLHMHTRYSDGTATHQELADIAQAAGVDVIVVTDHNVLAVDEEGWYGQTLVLVGEEIHDPARHPQASHTLCFDIRHDLAGQAADPQRLQDAVSADGGFTFIAHPFERDAASFLPEPNISWRDWDVTGYAGIELWNYMSEYKSAMKSKAHAVLLAWAPALAIAGPYPETLRRWDELLGSRPVAAFGGSDAHGNTYHLGPLERTVQPYDYLFRCVNTHLLLSEPLSGDLAHDKPRVYGALRAGRGYLGYEQPGDISRFSFWARSGQAEATMGETLQAVGPIELRVQAPGPARLRLLRDGRPVVQTGSDRLALVTREPGVYRVEATRPYAGRERGWIYSNPIYVRER